MLLAQIVMSDIGYSMYISHINILKTNIILHVSLSIVKLPAYICHLLAMLLSVAHNDRVVVIVVI